MPTCCVPGCTSGYRNDTSPVRHFFSAPSDEKLRLAWNRAIRRADKDLTTKSRVCSLHFYDQDILKTYVHVINGETVESPRGKWSLVDGALPKIFPNLPSYLTKPADKRRKRKRESNGATNHGTASPQSEEASCSIIPADAVEDNMPEPCAPSFSEIECVELPPSWQRITVENGSGKFAAFFTLKSENEALQIEKCVVVDSDRVATASGRGREAKAFLSVNIETMHDLSDLLSNVHKLHACSGYDVQGNSCISLRCQALSKQQMCSFCRTEKNRLLKISSQKQKRPKKARVQTKKK